MTRDYDGMSAVGRDDLGTVANTDAERRAAAITCADLLGYDCRDVLDMLGIGGAA